MRKWVSSVFATLVLAGPAQAQFCPGTEGWVFDDVLASDPFCGYITWMAQNGVSLGCQIVDTDHRLYCPAGNVSRSQMAAFVNRLTTQPNSTAPDVGTLTKPGGVFLHNFHGGTFLGVGAGNFTMNGDQNTAVGVDALRSVDFGYQNTAVGYHALRSNTGGSNNLAVGSEALKTNTTGIANTAVGQNALRDNIDGHGNTAIGSGAMQASSGGDDNIAIGYALVSNTQGISNVAIGPLSLSANTLGSLGIAIGYRASGANVSGNANVAIGSFALESNKESYRNVAVGYGALSSTSGGDNIGLGGEAGSSLMTGSFNIAIGNRGYPGDANTIRLGDGENHVRTFVAGIRGVTTAANDAINVVIDSNGQLGTVSSSRDAKDDIADMSDASTALLQLRPVTFHYKADRDPAGARLQYGLIAEEVAEVYPGMVANRNGKPETVMYQYLAPMLLNEYQKQQRTIEAQARELVAEREARLAQAREIADLRREMKALAARVAVRE
jgi:hypothetical protein